MRYNLRLQGSPNGADVSERKREGTVTRRRRWIGWDAQFYPDGIRGWMVKLDAHPEGGIAFDRNFFLEFEEGMRPHQVRLQGGDASSDSFCYS